MLKNIKNRTPFKGIFTIILILCATFLLFGCNEPEEKVTPDITPEYLSGDYATQLKNDGAELLLGSIELSKGDSGEIQMILHPKELVEDSNTESGYRIDSFALNRTFLLPEQAYITFLPEDQTEGAEMMTPEQFYQAIDEEYKAHGSQFTQYGDHKLYDVYVLDDQALLILAHYIPKAAS